MAMGETGAGIFQLAMERGEMQKMMGKMMGGKGMPPGMGGLM